MTHTHQIDGIMRALADRTRRAVYERIAATDEITVADLTRQSGVTQGAVSQHLKTLREAGLVAQRPAGRQVFYRANPQGLAPLTDWISHYSAFWQDRFRDLRDLLKEMDP
jgi:DNA-binding transcriptional ArsR family regulator